MMQEAGVGATEWCTSFSMLISVTELHFSVNFQTE